TEIAIAYAQAINFVLSLVDMPDELPVPESQRHRRSDSSFKGSTFGKSDQARPDSIRCDVKKTYRQRDPRRPAPFPAPLLPPQRQPRREAEAEPQPDVDDEQHVAVEPAARKRLEQADAVDVEPV